MNSPSGAGGQRPFLGSRGVCKAPGSGRVHGYYAAKGESAMNLELLRLIDEQYLHTDTLSRLGQRLRPAERRQVLLREVVTYLRGMCPPTLPGLSLPPVHASPAEGIGVNSFVSPKCPIRRAVSEHR